MRINQLLRENSAVTPDDMRAYQTEPLSERAKVFVPAFAQAARNGPPKPSLVRAGQMLSAWDRRYTTDNRAAVLFEAAMSNMSRLLWDEFRADDATSTPLGPIPTDMIAAVLLDQPLHAWWDMRSTLAVERRDEILADALEAAYDDLTERLGAPDSTSWQWSNHRTAQINHFLRIPSLSRRDIPMQGGSGTLNPSTGAGTHGASWRMVVELGDEMHAQAIYPGGQSGHPASVRYDDRLAAWSTGRLDTLRVPRTEAALPAAQRRARLTLSPNRN